MGETKSGGLRREKFEDLLADYAPYLEKAVAKYEGSTHPFHGREDLIQDLSIVLWKVWKKYPDRPDHVFHNIFASAIMNKLAEHFRLKSLNLDRETIHTDASGRKGAPGDGETYQLTRVEESEDFYRAGIFELLSTLPPEHAEVVLNHLNPSSRGPQPGVRSSYEAVKNTLNGF